MTNSCIFLVCVIYLAHASQKKSALLTGIKTGGLNRVTRAGAWRKPPAGAVFFLSTPKTFIIMNIRDIDLNQVEQLEAMQLFAKEWAKKNQDLLCSLDAEKRTQLISENIHAHFYDSEELHADEQYIINKAVQFSLADNPCPTKPSKDDAAK